MQILKHRSNKYTSKNSVFGFGFFPLIRILFELFPRVRIDQKSGSDPENPVPDP